MRKLFKNLGLGLALLCMSIPAISAVRLPALISDNMVLQQGRPVPIWGWADKGEVVTVSLGDQQYTSKAGDDGRWKIELKKLKPGKILEMSVKGSSGNSLTVKNILVGEVWICSGQSNMHWTFSKGHGVLNNETELANANYNDIRMFTVVKGGAPEPAEDTKGVWLTINRENLLVDGENGASVLAYFFGRDIYKQLNVPVGLINTSVGGTPAEKWTKREALEANPVLKSLSGKNGSSTLYNAMIAPLIPYAIRGAIWYQGESNLDRAFQYRTLFPAMIANWRSDWKQGDFPFGFVQIAPYRYKGQNPENYPELCEAQTMTLKSSSNTGMAVTADIGDVTNIHPKNKQEVGRRLALWAMAKVYGKKQMVYSGPIYKSMKIKGNQIVLNFNYCGSGLKSGDGKPLAEFTIAGADKVFVPAKAEIIGKTVVVSSEKVDNPAAVRYAWHDDAQSNLANEEGLPASLFRTDSWKGVTEK
jgi:sialate O-acetylesterase